MDCRSAKWLIAQRQLAVCSMALFLSGVLYATVALHVRVLALEEELAQLQGKNVSIQAIVETSHCLS